MNATMMQECKRKSCIVYLSKTKLGWMKRYYQGHGKIPAWVVVSVNLKGECIN